MEPKSHRCRFVSVYRELDEVLGLRTTMIESELTDSRTGKNTQHELLALLGQSVYSRLAGL